MPLCKDLGTKITASKESSLVCLYNDRESYDILISIEKEEVGNDSIWILRFIKKVLKK
jgi:hypothetical protein